VWQVASAPSQFDEFPGEGGPLIQVGHDWFTTIEGAKVLEGRLPDTARDDEAVINVPATEVGGRVGMVLTWRNLSLADMEALGGYPPDGWDWSQATGPVTRLRIVGVVRQPMESVLSFASGPAIWVSSAWAEAHLASSAVDFTNAVVRLRHGAADLPALEAGIARLYGRDDLPVKDLSDDIKRVQRSLDVERTALLLFAAAVIVATVFLIGQAFVRSVRSGSEGAPALRALGLDRRDLMAGLMAPHIVTIVTAALTAAATAVALSSRFPIGLGRRLDPELGIHLDWPALAVGVAITVAAVSLVCGLVAWRTVRQITARHRMPRTQFVGAATRAGASVPVAVGTSMALEPAPARTGATARPALVAAIVGVLGVVSAVTLVGGIDDVLHRPERIGQTWDLQATPLVDPSEVGGFLESTTTNLAGNRDVNAFALMSRAPTVVAGKGDVPLYSLRSLGGSVRFAMLQGRAPDGDDEVALGPRTASAIGARIGDTITVGRASYLVKVVGITLLAQTPHTSFDEGAWLTVEAHDAITGTSWEGREHSLLVRREG
jgi:putative ABC transport system permease protein